MTLTVVKTIVDNARDYIAGIDRTGLGAFALEERLIFLGEVTNRLWVSEVNSYYALSFQKALNKNLVRNGIPLHFVNAELTFWGNQRYGNSTDIESRLIQLQTVNANPLLHDYFLVGIWDTTTIEHFIGAGVDPMVAQSLLM